MASRGRTRFFEVAAIYTLDADALRAAREFLQHKIWSAEHAREQILMMLNRGVTTYQGMRHPQTGEPTGISRETQDLQALAQLRMWLDLYLFELVGVEDALTQAVNVAFNFDESSADTRLGDKIHQQLRQHLQATLKIRPPACDDTGLHAWRQPAEHGHPWLEDLRELRRQATHRHLVRMREEKSWKQKTMTPPLDPAKFRSDFYVDLGSGREEALDAFVALNLDRIVNLVNTSCDRLAVILSMLIEDQAGPVAAERRRAWLRSGAPGPCPHAVVEPRMDEDRVPLEPYFCSACGERIEDPAGKRAPNGSRYM